MHYYIALLHQESERYRVELADFPGCKAWTDSLRDAPRIAAAVLAEELQLRRTAGELIPPPSPPETVAAQAARAGAVPIVVPAPSPVGDRVSVSVDLPAGLVERVDRRARVHGVKRSDILEKAARLALWETGRIERSALAAMPAAIPAGDD